MKTTSLVKFFEYHHRIKFGNIKERKKGTLEITAHITRISDSHRHHDHHQVLFGKPLKLAQKIIPFSKSMHTSKLNVHRCDHVHCSFIIIKMFTVSSTSSFYFRN